MRLNKNIDIVSFLNDVKKCNGEVLFETKEGDRLNLKSALSQYVFFIADTKDLIIQKGELTFNNENYDILEKYLEK